MPSTIIVSYFFLYFLIPNYLLIRKHTFFIVYTFYTFIVASCFIIISILYGFVFLENLSALGAIPLTKSLPFVILGEYMVILFVIVIGLIVYNYTTSLKTDDLKTKFLQTELQLKEQELKFLKMQIQPHFLFNTLNTIYGLALQKKENAPEMILKLSSLLDYILYQVNKPNVLLLDEIQHLKDYISLEKMRFHDTLRVNFEVEITNQEEQISPMLLLPFLENSFKHGSIIDGFLSINIYLKATESALYFMVKNTSNKPQNSEKGIGLENIKKRLEMLYPQKHNLQIKEEENLFKTVLEIHF